MVIQKKFSSSQNADEKIEFEEYIDAKEGDIESQFMNELTISVEKSTKYKLNFFSSLDERSQGRILFGDIIWLSLIERKSHLQFEPKQTSLDTEQHHKEIQRVSVEEAKVKVMEKHYELLFKRNKNLHFEEFKNNQSKNTIGMWQIEGETRMKGGSLFWDSKIRLRHLSSNLYLSLKEIIISESNKQFLLTMEKRVTEDSLFMIKSEVLENNSLLVKDSFFHLFHCKTRLSFGMDQENVVKSETLNDKMIWNIFIQQNPSQENMMRFIKADAQELWEARYILSCLPILKSGIKLIENVRLF